MALQNVDSVLCSEGCIARFDSNLEMQKIIPARDPKQWGGAKGDETSGGDDDDDDTQMRAQRSRHMRAHMGEHTYESTHMRGQMRRHI